MSIECYVEQAREVVLSIEAELDADDTRRCARIHLAKARLSLLEHQNTMFDEFDREEIDEARD